MVSFTAFDFKLIIVMSLFLVIIGFVFPPLGFTSDTVQESNIPEFNASTNTFNSVLEQPEFPNNPSEGTLTYTHGAVQGQDERQIWLEGDAQNGYSVTLINSGTQSNPDMVVTLNRFNATGGYQESSSISGDQFIQHQLGAYTVGFENLRFTENNETVRVDWRITEQPEDSGWTGRIPLVGQIISGGQQIAAVLAWGLTLLQFVIIEGMILAFNILIGLLNVIVFVITFFYWLLSTYATITTNAPTVWAGTFMAIPGVILSFEFAKVMILVIRTVFDGAPLT
jgi:hypothetical protein